MIKSARGVGRSFNRNEISAPKAINPLRLARKLHLKALQEKLRDERLKNRPIDYWYDRSIDSVVSNLHERNHYDVVIAEYVVWSRCLKLFDGSVRKIVDTIDVLSNRYEILKKPRSLRHSGRGDRFRSRRPMRERDLIGPTSSSRFRMVIATIPIGHVQANRHVGHILPRIIPPVVNGIRNKLLFVGSPWAPKSTASPASSTRSCRKSNSKFQIRNSWWRGPFAGTSR